MDRSWSALMQWYRDKTAGRVWLRCVHCNRELTRPRSQAIGLGTTCVEEVGASELAELKRTAEHRQRLAEDRALRRAECLQAIHDEVPEGESPEAFRARKALNDHARARMRALREHQADRTDHGRGS